jgi:hypothetical protein
MYRTRTQFTFDHIYVWKHGAGAVLCKQKLIGQYPPILLPPLLEKRKLKLKIEDIRLKHTKNRLAFVLTFISNPQEQPLTLIRAAGGVYDFQNFEQVQLHNVLSNEKC